MNSNGTTYQNGRFVNVDEVHNNTKNMTLSGFNQEGGTVTGNIENLTIESKQNTSTTKGSTKGGSLSVSANGLPSGSVNYSQTNGSRNYVDNASTFIVGEGSNLSISKAENIAGAIGTSENGKIKIDEYTGRDLENSDKLKTVGANVGISTSGITSFGVNYSNSETEGRTRNTVVGNVEIGKSLGDEINTDLSTMTEESTNEFKTDVNVEAQTLKYITNPSAFKEDLKKAKEELKDIKHTVDVTVNRLGEDKRNSLQQLAETRQAKTIYNLVNESLRQINNQDEIAGVFEEATGELGYKVKLIYTDPSKAPQLLDEDGNAKDGTAFVNKATRENYILINTNSPANVTKAGLIGTIAEEQSHVIGGVEKRQKVVPTEKGQESLGRATNKYFKDKFGENDEAISLVSDGQDYSNVDFGENVGDKISPEDRAFRAYYRAEVLPYDEDYKNFIVQGVNLGIDMSPLGVSKGMTEGLLGYDAITGEKLDIVTRTMGVIPLFDKTYGFVRAGMKTLKPATRVEAVLSDGTRVLIKSNIDDIAIKNIEKLEKIKKGITSVDTSKAVNKIDIPSNINKIEKITETPKIRAVDNSISTKNLNKDLHEKINNRDKGYYAHLQEERNLQKTIPNFDFEHIIGGDMSKNGKKVAGGHSLIKGDVRITKVVDKPDKFGVYNAKIEIFNSKTGKWQQKTTQTNNKNTMFPKNWNEERIILEVKSAWGGKDFKIEKTMRGKEWSGTSISGVKIKGYINPDKVTAFPEYGGVKK